MKTFFQKRDYLVQTTIIEARELKGREDSGTCDPFVKISVASQVPQVTTTARATSTVTWNQSFTFKDLNLAQVELENMEILIEVMDHMQFSFNRLIGSHSIGLATLYRNMNHEFFNTWVTLLHPEKGSEPQGFLLISCYIVGKGDQPPVHSINEGQQEDGVDDLEGLEEDELTPEQIRRRKDMKKNVSILSKPTMTNRGYQLSVKIAKAEDLPKMGFSTVDSFISVRCEGITLTTPVVSNSQKPTFNSKLQFPVFVPVLNDKVVIRVWDKRSGIPDVCIASIPEIPSDSDYFNINTLLAKGGIMPYRWVNLYGIPPEDRNSELYKLFVGKQKVFEGTGYLGRVLLSLTLTPNEKPQKGRFPLNSYGEPRTIDHFLYVDVYELQEAMECNDEVWIKVTFGGLTAQESKHVPMHHKKEGGEKVPVKGSYYWKGDGVSIKEISGQFPNDDTQHPDVFIDLYTSTLFGSKRVGYVRIPNIDKCLAANTPKWFPVKSSENNVDENKQGFILLNAYLTKSKVKQRIPKKRNIDSDFIFIAFIYAAYDIAPNMSPDDIAASFEIRVAGKSLIPRQQANVGKFPMWDEYINEEVKMCDNLEFAPNIVVKLNNTNKTRFSDEFLGEFAIPAMDCQVIKKLEEFQREPKLYIIYKDGYPAGRMLAKFTLAKGLKKGTNIAEFCKAQKIERISARVEVAVLGVRNLNPAMSKPVLKAKIHGSDQEAKQIEPMPNNSGASDFKNPNFLKNIVFEKVSIPNDALYLPYLTLSLEDSGFLGNKYFIDIPLVEYCDWRSSQKIAEAITIFQTPMIEVFKSQKKEEEIKGKKDEKKNEVKKVIIGEIAADKKEEDDWDLEKLNEGLADKRDLNDSQRSEDEELLKEKALKDTVNFRFELIEAMDCTMRDKKSEFEDRKIKIEELKLKIKDLEREQKPDYNLKSAWLQEIEKLNDEYIKDDIKFLGKENKADEFDYGRDIIKESLEEGLRLPYVKYELYKMSSIGKSCSERDGLIVSGLPTGFILKGRVRIVPDEEDGKSRKSKSSKKTSKTSRTSRTSKSKAVQYDLDPEYPFDLFQYLHMNIFRTIKPLKIRLYLLRGLNLCAQADVAEIHHMLAGLGAMSSADTYPLIKVGDPNKGGYDLTKEIKDELALIKQNLNPAFFKFYELDCQFPEDWFVSIGINQKGLIADKLIGETRIDIEDRYFGDLDVKQKLVYQARKKFLEDELRDLEAQQSAEDPVSPSGLTKEQIRQELTHLTGKLEMIQYQKAPVEYRALCLPGQTTSMGSVEMFMEILPLELARTTPVAKIEPPKPSVYEIRFIIYETFEIPRARGPTVDVFVTVSYAPGGWSGEETVKRTDTHMGSEDGWAIFNWRMKFPLTIPCPFPRIRVSAYDSNIFTSDEQVGEALISMKRIVRKLQTEGRYELEPRKIQLQHPNDPGKPKGEVKYSIQIIPKQEADADPVGEAQEEPNKNPYLEKPKVGRGLGDLFKGSWGFGAWFAFIKKVLCIALVLFVTVLVIIICFVKPGLFVK